MKLMEYQGKDLFRRVGIPTPRGTFATTAADVQSFIAANPGSWVLKSQVMMGGRGKAGGIKFADDAAQGNAAIVGLKTQVPAWQVGVLFQGAENAIVQGRHVDHSEGKRQELEPGGETLAGGNSLS